MNRPEQDMQRAIFKHIAARGAHNAVFWHCPNGGKRSKIEAAIMKGLGVKPGVPDINAVMDGRFFALELKAPGGAMSIPQIDMQRSLRDAGAVIGVARSLDEAIDWLEEHGLLKGTRQ